MPDWELLDLMWVDSGFSVLGEAGIRDTLDKGGLKMLS